MRHLTLLHIWVPEVYMLPYVESPFSTNGMMKITKVTSWNACKALGQWAGSSNKGAWHTGLVTRVNPQSPIKAVGGNRLRKVGLWPPQLFCGNSERPNHHEIYKRANKNHFTASLHGSRLCLGVKEIRLQVRGQPEPYLFLGTDKMLKALALKA